MIVAGALRPDLYVIMSFITRMIGELGTSPRRGDEDEYGVVGIANVRSKGRRIDHDERRPLLPQKLHTFAFPNHQLLRSLHSKMIIIFSRIGSAPVCLAGICF